MFFEYTIHFHCGRPFGRPLLSVVKGGSNFGDFLKMVEMRLSKFSLFYEWERRYLVSIFFVWKIQAKIYQIQKKSPVFYEKQPRIWLIKKSPKVRFLAWALKFCSGRSPISLLGDRKPCRWLICRSGTHKIELFGRSWILIDFYQLLNRGMVQ